jgi:lysophospholipase L1-like esterase
MTTILARIRALTAPSTRVVVLGYWNVVEDGKAAAKDYTAEQRAASLLATKAADDVMRAADVAAQAVFVPTIPVFHGANGKADPTPLLISDGDHPNLAGHQAIAAAVAAAVPLLP